MEISDRRTTRPTLADIAARAGVSKSLVSLALRGEAGVRDEPRRRILDAAQELGRSPSAHARRMVEGTRVIGVVVTDLDNPFHADVVRGMDRAADPSGYSIVVANGGRDTERMARHLRMFDRIGAEGLVLVTSWLPEHEVAGAGRLRPVVVVGTSVAGVAGTDTVRGDMRMGIKQTVEHLIASGHRRIGFVSESEHSSSRRRHASYLEEMARFMVRDATVSVHVDELAQDPSRLRALVTERGFTAFIAANDITAVTVIEASEAAGLRVPHDVAVAGYDNTHAARIIRPQLTSVEQPWEQMGARALAFLRERALGRKTDRHEVVTPTLIPRASTGG